MKPEEEKEEDFDFDEYYRDFPPLLPIFIVVAAICVGFYFLFT